MTVSDWKVALGIVTTAFGLGWGTSEAIMWKAGQDKVPHGTYILKDDLKNGYIEKKDYEQAIADLQAIKLKLEKMEVEREELKSKISTLSNKKEHRIELQKEQDGLQSALEIKRKELGMLSFWENMSAYRGVPKNTEAMPQLKHEISMIEARIAEINKYIMGD